MAEDRRKALIRIDRLQLPDLMRDYFNPSISWEGFKSKYPNNGLCKDAFGFKAKEARTMLQKVETYDQSKIIRFDHHPFDSRWPYVSYSPTLWSRPIPSLKPHYWEGNSFLISRMNTQANPEGVPMFYTRHLYDRQFSNRNPQAIPIQFIQEPSKRKKGDHTNNMFFDRTANLSESSRIYLGHLGIKNPDQSQDTAALVWMHSLAIGYSPDYLSENTDGIRQDWPRIPLPDSREKFLNSAALGTQIATLLDTESKVKSVTSGTIRAELRTIGVATHISSNSINPAIGELDMSAGWGHFGKDNVVMPGKGKVVERSYTSKERALMKKGTEKLGLTLKQAIEQLGETTCDIYLNDVAYWSNIPANVWNYYIGGYQVIKKWLSYREKEILGRGLKIEEVHEVMNMTRRIAAIILLQPALAENYNAVKKSTYSWPGEKG